MPTTPVNDSAAMANNSDPINITEPSSDLFNIGVTQYPSDAWDLLNTRLSDSRRNKMLAVSEQRTNHIRLVAQDILSPHNVSACMRSAEAFGVLNVDVVNLGEPFNPSTVARGVHHWLRINKHQSISSCAQSLHEQGYIIAAGMPTQASRPIEDLPVDRPIAVLFGNEHAGVSPEWAPYIDQYFTIPMCGFVESLNISVSAAITLNRLTERARTSLGDSGGYFLSPQQRKHLLNEWVCRHISSWKAETDVLRARLGHTKPQ